MSQKYLKKLGNDELYSRQINAAKESHEITGKECQTLTKKISEAELDFVDNSMSPTLMQETAQMERMVLSIEQNALKASHALDEVDRQMASLNIKDNTAELKKAETEMVDGEVLTDNESKVMEAEFRAKIKKSATRMKEIFSKAHNHYNQMVDTFSVDCVHSVDPKPSTKEKEDDTERQAINSQYPIELKLNKLRTENEMAQSKARSSETQRMVDKEKYEKIIADYERETQLLLSKLAVAQSNKRFQEQVGRDDNNAAGAVSVYEYQELEKELQNIKEELARSEFESKEKDLTISSLNNELQSVQYELQSSQDVKSKLQKVNNELTKKEAHFGERLAETTHKLDNQISMLEDNLDKAVSELNMKQRELESLSKERDELKASIDSSVNENKRLCMELKETMNSESDAIERAENFQNRISILENELRTSGNKVPPASDVASPRKKNDKDRVRKLSKEISAAIAAKDKAEEENYAFRQKIDELTKALKVEKNKAIGLEQMKAEDHSNVETEDLVQNEPDSPPNEAHDLLIKDKLIGSLEQEISSLKNELADLPKRLSSKFESEAKNQEEEIIFLQSQLRDLQVKTGVNKSSSEATVERQIESYPLFSKTEQDSVQKVHSASVASKNSNNVHDCPPAETRDVLMKDTQSSLLTNSQHSAPTKHMSTPEVSLCSSFCQTDPSQTLVENKPLLSTVSVQTDGMNEEEGSGLIPPEKEDNEDNSSAATITQAAVKGDDISYSSSNSKRIKSLKIKSFDDSIDEEDPNHSLGNELKIKHSTSDSSSKKQPEEIESSQNESKSEIDDIEDPFVSRSSNSTESIVYPISNTIDETLSKESKEHDRIPDQSTAHSSGASMVDMEQDRTLSNADISSNPSFFSGSFSSGSFSGTSDTNIDVQKTVSIAMREMLPKFAGVIARVPLRDRKSFIGDIETALCRHLSSNKSLLSQYEDNQELLSTAKGTIFVMMTSLSKYCTYEANEQVNESETTLSSPIVGVNDDVNVSVGVSGDKTEVVAVATDMPNSSSKKASLVSRRGIEDMSHHDYENELAEKDRLLFDAKLTIDETKANEALWRKKYEEAKQKVLTMMSEIQSRVSGSGEYPDKSGDGDAQKEKPKQFSRQKTVASMMLDSRESSGVSNSEDIEETEEQNKTAQNLKFVKTIAKVQAASKKLKLSRASNLLNEIRSKDSLVIVRDFDKDDKEQASDESDEELPEPDPAYEKSLLLKERKSILQSVKGNLVATLGDIKSKNFEKLCTGKYGPDDIVFLTRFQFFINNMELTTKPLKSRDAFKMRSISVRKSSAMGGLGVELQRRAAQVELQSQQNIALKKYSVEDIAKYLHETEKDLLLHSSFSAWQKLQRLQEDGNFIDCLSEHKSSLKKLIDLAGGYKQALIDIKMKRQPLSDTSFWEDKFRVKVLEYYRQELLLDIDDLKKERHELTSKVDETNAKLENVLSDVEAQRKWSLKQIASMSKQLRRHIKLPAGSASNGMKSALEEALLSKSNEHSDEDAIHENSDEQSSGEDGDSEESEEFVPMIIEPLSTSSVPPPVENSITEDIVEPSLGTSEGECRVNETRSECISTEEKNINPDNESGYLDLSNKEILGNHVMLAPPMRVTDALDSGPVDEHLHSESQQNETEILAESPFSGEVKSAAEDSEGSSNTNTSNQPKSTAGQHKRSSDQKTFSSTSKGSRRDKVKKHSDNGDDHIRPKQKQSHLAVTTSSSQAPSNTEKELPTDSSLSHSHPRKKKLNTPHRKSSKANNTNRTPKAHSAARAVHSEDTQDRKGSATKNNRNDYDVQVPVDPLRSAKVDQYDNYDSNLILKLRIGISELAIELYRRSESGVQLANALIPLLENFDDEEKRVDELNNCLSLYRENDIVRLLSASNIPEEELEIASESWHFADMLREALKYSEEEEKSLVEITCIKCHGSFDVSNLPQGKNLPGIDDNNNNCIDSSHQQLDTQRALEEPTDQSREDDAGLSNGRKSIAEVTKYEPDRVLAQHASNYQLDSACQPDKAYKKLRNISKVDSTHRRGKISAHSGNRAEVDSIGRQEKTCAQPEISSGVGPAHQREKASAHSGNSVMVNKTQQPDDERVVLAQNMENEDRSRLPSSDVDNVFQQVDHSDAITTPNSMVGVDSEEPFSLAHGPLKESPINTSDVMNSAQNNVLKEIAKDDKSIQTESVMDEDVDADHIEHDLKVVCPNTIQSSSLRSQEEEKDLSDVLLYVQIRQSDTDITVRLKHGLGTENQEVIDNNNSTDSTGSGNSCEEDPSFSTSVDKDIEGVKGVELSPGVCLISNVVTVCDAKTDKKKTLKLPSNVVIVRKRKKTTPLFKGIVPWTKWDKLDINDAPVFPSNILAVEIPPILDLNPHCHLLSDCSLPFNLDIPKDTWVVAVRRNTINSSVKELCSLIPKEFISVTLSPNLVVSSDLQERLEPNKFLVEVVPHDGIMIQNRYAAMPVGFMFSPGVTLAAARCLPPSTESDQTTEIDSDSKEESNAGGASDQEKGGNKNESKEDGENDSFVPLSLPPGVICVNIDRGATLPSYLHLLKLEDSTLQVGVEEERRECRLETESILYNQSVIVLECPISVKLLPGMLLVKRPVSLNGNPLPLPPTMSLCPPHLIPKRFLLKNGIELVQLAPFFSFPDGIKLCKGVQTYQTPAGILLEPDMVLVRRYAGANIPPYCRAGVIPYYSDDIYLPPDIEAIYLPKGTRLPVGAVLAKGITVVDVPGFDMTTLQPGVYFIRREDSAISLPIGFMPAPQRLLPLNCTLPIDVEVVYFRPQFYLPPGVVMAPGAFLPRDVQLPPGLEILPNVEVVKWPYGVYLPSNFECVKKVNRAFKYPADIVIVDPHIQELTQDKNAANDVPQNCCFIRLPSKISLPCAAELVDQCVLTSVPAIVANDPSLTSDLRDCVFIRRRDPTVFNTKHKFNQQRYSMLPAEFIRQSNRVLPAQINCSLPKNVIIVKVHSHFTLPKGVEVAPNVFVDSHADAPFIPCELAVVKSDNIPNTVSPSGIQVYPMSRGSSNFSSSYRGVWFHNNLHNILSWGNGYEKFRPIRYPALPQGYFLIAQPVKEEDESLIPPYLEMIPVGMESSVCSGLRLPPGTRIVRIPPRQTLPCGISVDSFDALPCFPSVQFCPGDNTAEYGSEFYPSSLEKLVSCKLNGDYNPKVVNSLVSCKAKSILSDDDSSLCQNVDLSNADVFREVDLELPQGFLKNVSDRIMENLLVTRAHTLDRGKNFGYINATIMPPSLEAEKVSVEDDFVSSLPLIMHQRPFTSPAFATREVKASRPLNRQLSRSIGRIFQKTNEDRGHLIMEQLLDANKRDLDKALQKLESVEEELELSLKSNRRLTRTNDSNLKEIDHLKKRIERMTSHTSSLNKEMQATRDERNKAQAQLTMDGTVTSAKIETLTSEKRNLTYVVAEKEDIIESLQEKIQYMKDNNGITKLQKAENMRQQQIAVNNAVAEYRKLLKIGVSSAYDAVKAVRDYCSRDTQNFSQMKLPNHSRGHAFMEDVMDDDSLSVLTEDESLVSEDWMSSSAQSKYNDVSIKTAFASSTPNKSFLPDLHNSQNSTRSLPRAKTSGGFNARKVRKRPIGLQQKTVVNTLKKDKQNHSQSAGTIVVDEEHVYSISQMCDSSSRKKPNNSKPDQSNDISIAGSMVSSLGSTKNISHLSIGKSLAGLELLDAPIRSSNSSLEVSLASIDIDSFLDSLDKAFTFVEKDVDTSKMSKVELELHKLTKPGTYKLDVREAEAIAAFWLQNAIRILTECLGNSLRTYAHSALLLEREISSHVADKKKMSNRIRYLEDKYKDAVTAKESSHEALQSFRMEELRKALEHSTSHLDNVRALSTEPLLKALKQQADVVKDLETQQTRLESSAAMVEKKRSSTIVEMKKHPIDNEKRRRAKAKYLEYLEHRAEQLRARASDMRCRIDEVSSSIRLEFEAFEGALQDTISSSVLLRVLSYSAMSSKSKHTRETKEDTNTTEYDQKNNKLKSSDRTLSFSEFEKQLNGEETGNLSQPDELARASSGLQDDVKSGNTSQIRADPFNRNYTGL